jgi:hypothetical protein
MSAWNEITCSIAIVTAFCAVLAVGEYVHDWWVSRRISR